MVRALEEHQAIKNLSSDVCFMRTDAWRNEEITSYNETKCHMSEDPVSQWRPTARTQGSSQSCPWKMKDSDQCDLIHLHMPSTPCDAAKHGLTWIVHHHLLICLAHHHLYPRPSLTSGGFQQVCEFTSPCNKRPPDHVRSLRSVVNQRRASATWSDPGCEPRTASHARHLLPHTGGYRAAVAWGSLMGIQPLHKVDSSKFRRSYLGGSLNRDTPRSSIFHGIFHCKPSRIHHVRTPRFAFGRGSNSRWKRGSRKTWAPTGTSVMAPHGSTVSLLRL